MSGGAQTGTVIVVWFPVGISLSYSSSLWPSSEWPLSPLCLLRGLPGRISTNYLYWSRETGEYQIGLCFSISLYMCVCVCVCVEEEWEWVPQTKRKRMIKIEWSKRTERVQVCVCVCVVVCDDLVLEAWSLVTDIKPVLSSFIRGKEEQMRASVFLPPIHRCPFALAYKSQWQWKRYSIRSNSDLNQCVTYQMK